MNHFVSALPAAHPMATELAGQSRRVAGVDLAFVHDGCALVVTDRTPDRIDVCDLDFRIPRPGAPFDSIELTGELLDRARGLGVVHVTADVHYVGNVRHEADSRGMVVVNAPVGDERIRAFVLLRDYVRRRLIRMPRLAAEHLSAIKLVARPGGTISIVADRTSSRGHADIAFALAAAVWVDARVHGPLGQMSIGVGAFRGGWQ